MQRIGRIQGQNHNGGLDLYSPHLEGCTCPFILYFVFSTFMIAAISASCCVLLSFMPSPPEWLGSIYTRRTFVRLDCRATFHRFELRRGNSSHLCARNSSRMILASSSLGKRWIFTLGSRPDQGLDVLTFARRLACALWHTEQMESVKSLARTRIVRVSTNESIGCPLCDY
jgi:hypothetical protein